MTEKQVSAGSPQAAEAMCLISPFIFSLHDTLQMAFPAEPFLCEVSRLVEGNFYYSYSGFVYEETNVW